ncbi:polysaccharide deacetylase [Paenibacillus swuensis]|uniref:polysaccharide deacetylase n=1 Tax=Paenibacillus swuensis TaxID=1178515 RepID=UPI0008393842|nr:polysaccharide deacetylase [Paenibacillus swuensis]
MDGNGWLRKLQRAAGVAGFVLRILLWIGCIGVIALSAMKDSVRAEQRRTVASGEELYKQLARGERILKEQSYVVPEQKTVYLTFDDGPSALTPQVLDILAAEDVKATFFQLGEAVQAHPDYVRRVLKEGHALGNHTYDHEYSDIYGDFAAFWEQIQRTERAFVKAVGEAPKLVRAPGGTYRNFDAFYFYFMDQAGYQVHDWNIDSRDAKRRNVPASEIVEAVRSSKFGHEAVVLMHDGTGHEESVKALPAIIKMLKEKGYHFAAMTEQVKPVVFAVGPQTKWKRTTSYAEFLRESSFAPIVKKESQGPNLAVSVREKIQAAPPAKGYLETKWRDASVRFPKSEVIYQNEQAFVALRSIANETEGNLTWNSDTDEVSWHYGEQEMRYTLDSADSVWEGPTDGILKDGRLYVPLTEVLSILNGDSLFASI